MKTKTQIKQAISLLYAEKRCSRKYPLFCQIVDAQIAALKFALGWKSPLRFWCPGCNLVHIGIKCPNCGNSKIMRTNLAEFQAIKGGELYG